MCILFRRAWRLIFTILNNPPDAGHAGNRFRLPCLHNPKTMNNHHHNTNHADKILSHERKWAVEVRESTPVWPHEVSRAPSFTLFPMTTQHPSQHHIGMRWQHQRNQMWKRSCDLCWNSCWPGVTQRKSPDTAHHWNHGADVRFPSEKLVVASNSRSSIIRVHFKDNTWRE